MNKVEHVRALLQIHDLPIKQLCNDIGVSRRWHDRFKGGDFKDPSYNKIEALDQWLAAHLENSAA